MTTISDRSAAQAVGDRPGAAPGRRRPEGGVVALAVAALWSVAALGAGAAWALGAPGNPADPSVDPHVELALIGTWGPRTGAVVLAALGATGVVLAGIMLWQRPPSGRAGVRHRVPVITAVLLGLVLAVALPDYRLLATIAYLPILAVLWLVDALPEGIELDAWPLIHMAVVSVAGVAWLVAARWYRRRTEAACGRCGRGARQSRWSRPEVVARWARLCVGVAVVIPVGYAITRYAWALGIPLGVRQQLLDELGDGVWAGAALATLAVGGAVLTLGLVQRWGEVFPRWTMRLRGRPVPVWLAVVPATAVSVVVASAGLMFVRFWALGEIGESFPGVEADVAGWLPEMFWPLWGAALAAAAYAYRLRRRGTCTACGRG